MKTKQAWKLPIVFLLGYLFAWGSILPDRQMIIDEQRSLQEKVNHTWVALKIPAMIYEYNKSYVEMVNWNREAIKEQKDVEDRKNMKGAIND